MAMMLENNDNFKFCILSHIEFNYEVHFHIRKEDENLRSIVLMHFQPESGHHYKDVLEN